MCFSLDEGVCFPDNVSKTYRQQVFSTLIKLSFLCMYYKVY